MVSGEQKYLVAKPIAVKHRRTMVCIHGMAGFAAYLIPKMEYFAERGYTCFAPDIVGHGERNKIDVSGLGVLDYVADVNDFIDHTVRKENDAPLILLGHSMGGLIAAKLAEMRTDVGHAVLVTPAPPNGVLLLPGGMISFTLDDVRRLIKMMLGGARFVPSRHFLESLFANPKASKHIIDQWEARRMSNESLLVALQLGMSHVAVDARKINAHMLVIGAKKDKVVHHRVAKKIQEHYGADYHLIEDLGHMCPFEAGWEQTAAIIETWLKEKKAHI